ncbi:MULTISPECIES: hypothetical protein [unclassified Dietzia]|uniref:hypothetical protein n=1 Tax=unclassified Dietzia TaxID=2617939 RepID=UPI0015F93D65|nr:MULTISPECIES: hypothetical protein [unclassified Dietzia]MBB1025046.1 hypothetical protein [Dietzia sp. DQ12-76]MBB1027363.1 hypothetical protein [Dietzia sp. DQ11-38-2]
MSRSAKDEAEAERKREIHELNRRIHKRRLWPGQVIRPSHFEAFIVVAATMYLLTAWLLISPMIVAFWPR